jgi:REP element-mobilizing transposase RayT
LVLTTLGGDGILFGMARKLRVEYPGAIYHVMNRGDRREEIFKDDPDRERLLAALGEVCVKTGWQVHALCLMPNHFHLVVETPQGNLVAGMKWLLGTYTARFNRRHKVFGHLFSGRYKALIVDGSGTGYLKAVCDYVHLNPARAKLLTPEQPLTAYRWSSWPEYLKSPGKRPAWLRVDRLLGEYRIPQDSAAGRRVLAHALEARRQAEAGTDYKLIRRGWCLGEETFRKELLAQMSERIGAEHYGAERLETVEAKAERIVREELKRRRWQETDLAKRAKGDLGKVQIAGRLRAETLVTVKWIAARLGMGTAGYVNNRLYRWRKGTLA